MLTADQNAVTYGCQIDWTTAQLPLHLHFHPVPPIHPLRLARATLVTTKTCRHSILLEGDHPSIG